jgi:hypothetical protein
MTRPYNKKSPELRLALCIERREKVRKRLEKIYKKKGALSSSEIRLAKLATFLELTIAELSPKEAVQ